MTMRRAHHAMSGYWPDELEDHEDEEHEWEDHEYEGAFELPQEWEGELSRDNQTYVAWIQRSLNRLMGARLPVDGKMSNHTRAVIRAFQMRQGVGADGKVGARTEAAMIKAGAPPPPSGPTPPPAAGSTLASVDTVLPRAGVGFYSYHPGGPDRQYGTADTIRALRVIGQKWAAIRPIGPRIGIGDISFRRGGHMPPHLSHDKGIDADIRLMRNDGKEDGVTYRDATYSRDLTQKLVDTIRANGVLPIKVIYFNDPAVTGVKQWKGHDNHLHVRFVPSPSQTPSSSSSSPSPSSFPSTSTSASARSDPRVVAAIKRWNLATGVATAPKFSQLVDRYRPKHFPLPLLVAFSSLEASGWEDATHGTPKNRWTSPAFYELGVFQVPAGLHGVCTSSRYQSCTQHQPPGEDARRKSAWFRICDALGLNATNWTDPTTQVRVGVQNLESDAATVRAQFPALFPDKGSDWALRASVLLPFGPGIGYTRNLLRRHRAALEGMAEGARWGFLRTQGAKTANVDEKMTLAHKLADASGMSSSMPPTSA
jgi:peptidoglycan hydrolase-like protein with peptidoglycan-binding domain